MTVALVATIQRFNGLSSDSKPSTPPIGTEFFETDTGDTYVYSAAGWKIKPLSVKESALLDPLAGNETITFSSEDVKTLTVPTGAELAVITIEVGSIRKWDTGATPTSSTGEIINSGDTFIVPSPTAMANLKMIRTAAVSVKATVAYYKRVAQ